MMVVMYLGRNISISFSDGIADHVMGIPSGRRSAFVEMCIREHLLRNKKERKELSIDEWRELNKGMIDGTSSKDSYNMWVDGMGVWS